MLSSVSFGDPAHVPILICLESAPLNQPVRRAKMRKNMYDEASNVGKRK
jgi:hypothetical protein